MGGDVPKGSQRSRQSPHGSGRAEEPLLKAGMLPIRKVGTGGAFILEIQPVIRPPFGEAALSFHSATSHKRALIGLCSQAARIRVTPQKITSKALGFPTRAGQG